MYHTPAIAGTLSSMTGDRTCSSMLSVSGNDRDRWRARVSRYRSKTSAVLFDQWGVSINNAWVPRPRFRNPYGYQQHLRAHGRSNSMRHGYSSRRIPNVLTFGAAAAGAALPQRCSRAVVGFGVSASGWLVGALVMFVPFALGGLGGGDVKLLGCAWELDGSRQRRVAGTLRRDRRWRACL